MICCFDVEPSSDVAGTDRFVEIMKEIAPKAEKQGVIIALENWLSAEDNMRIIERIGSPAVQVYYDVGNSTDKGRDVVKEIRTLGKLICELHFKDDKHLLGQGRIDFKKVREAIDAVGYRGWIQLESAAPNGVMVDYKSQGQFVRSLFPHSDV
jgi:sugar phosphate isomerase/epimerase